MERPTMRFAHSNGHTDVCYSEDGTKIITCGADGDVRIFEGFSDDDPVQSCVGSWSLSVQQKDDKLYIATDNNTVQMLTFPGAERDGLLTRFSAPVNHISTGKNHKYIALAGEEMEVKLMTLPPGLENASVKLFTNFDGPPLSVEVCPKGELVAVSSGDGMLRVWKIATEELIKKIQCVPKANSFMNAKVFCRMSFEPFSGINLAYPDGKSVNIVSTVSWSQQLSLKCNQIECAFSIVEYSPCGQYLAASSVEGDVAVWDVNTGSLIGCTSHPYKFSICSMRWNPSGNGEIAYCDVHGKLGVINNCNGSSEKVAVSAENRHETEVDDEKMDFNDIRFEPEDDDDEDNENAISLEKLKKDIMGDDDEDPELAENATTSRASSRTRCRTPEIPLQKPFQPSSTPEHLSPRYLCWNEVGIVRCFGNNIEDDDSENQSIEVEFLDSTFHSSMMMQNYQGYTMASISSGALVVANSKEAKVVPLASGTKEWTIALPEEEEIVCVTASSKLICLGTSGYQLRIFSVYGTQCLVVSVGGPFVCLASHGYNAVVAYHTSGPRKTDQCIGLMHVYCKGKAVNNKYVECPIGPEANLQWLGFSDQGSLVAYDSAGVLRLCPHKSNVWLPCMDFNAIKTSVSDGFFVTAVMESRQVVRGIRCKGTVYPGFTPQPVQTELPLQPLFLEMDTEKTQLEANLCTLSVLNVPLDEKKYKENALKLFALACKSNLDQRALELIEMLSSTQLLNLAAKYASKLNKTRLAEKLEELSTVLDDNAEEEHNASLRDSYRVREEYSYASYSSPATPVIKPLSKKLVLSSSKYSSQKNRSLSSSASKSTQDSSNGAEDTQEATNSSLATPQPDVDTQDQSLFDDSDAIPKIPFLKKNNKNSSYNPLSLTDKYAGYNPETTKENKSSNTSESEKRKCTEPIEVDKQKEKQRKLDGFMFKKRN